MGKGRWPRSRQEEWTYRRMARVDCMCSLLSAYGPNRSPDSVAAPLRYSHLLLLAGNLDGRSRLLYGRCPRRRSPARKPYRMSVLRPRSHFRGIPLRRRVRCVRVAWTVQIAGVGPGSSQRDFDAVGLPFDKRWKRFEESVVALRALLDGTNGRLEPRPSRRVPIWIGSWGSDAGLSRVARLADGWLASAYNTTPEQFAAARESLRAKLVECGRDAEGFPNALVTMWTWVTEDRAEAERVLGDVLAPLLKRD